MNVDEYLRRINSEGLKEVNLENLAHLQIKNCRSVAFENCDIHSGKHINMSLTEAYERIVHGSRGGWCIQLNSVFAWMLASLGYKCYFVQAHGYNPKTNTRITNPLHIGIIVTLNSKLYWVDVSSSGYVSEPLEIEIDLVQTKFSGTYRFVRHPVDVEMFCMQRFLHRLDQWVGIYDFKLTPRAFEDFADANEFAQSASYPSLFCRSYICIHTTDGYMRLVGTILTQISICGNEQTKTETKLTAEEAKQTLRDKFNLVVDDSFEPKDELINNPNYY